MSVKFSNNGHSTLASSLTTSATSITVASGHGARFPSLSGSEYFYATLIDSSNNLEIVKVTARSSDVLTVTRAQESTTARAYAVGDRVELRVTAQGLVDVGTPVADSITNAMMADDAIDAAQIVDNAVGAAALNVSGNGSTGQYLESDGDGSMSWSTISAGLVQTVLGTVNTALQQGGTSYNIDIAEGTITPSSSSNIIIGIATSHGSVTNSNGGGTSRDSFFRIDRLIGGSGTQIQETSQRMERNVGGDDIPCMATMVFRDSPSTTSAVTYKMQTKGEGGGWDTFWNQNGSIGTMLLMEVKV